MYKLNLHAHSEYSDGHDSIVDIAKAYNEYGFSSCIITDHVYSGDHNISLNLEKFQRQLEEAKRLMDNNGYPIILGAEFTVAKTEECLVFGTEAILELLKIRQNQIEQGYLAPVSIDDLKTVRDKFDCAVILCHPNLPEYQTEQGRDFIQIGGVDVIDGFEAYNSGHYFFKKREIPKEFDGLLQLCNSDAHSAKCLMRCWNLVEDDIKNEKSLISYIHDRKNFLPVVEPYDPCLHF